MGVSATEKRIPNTSGTALCLVRDELEPILISSGYCEDAPFSWVTIAIRYGSQSADIPRYQAINKKYGDLPLSIEVSSEDIQGATLDGITILFRGAALRSLIHAGEKYDRPVDALKSLFTGKR